MLSATLDIFRLRQYFNVLTRAREVAAGIREDSGLVADACRALVPLPFGAKEEEVPVFGKSEPFDARDLPSRRVALVATGGSGALASVVGVAKALEEAGVRPAVVSLCSGSSLFGFPIAAGVPADEVADFTSRLDPDDLVDLDWRRIGAVLPTLGRGFAGVLRGDAVERSYRRLLGDMTLRELAVPAYAPIWNIEANRLEYLGPKTHPDLEVARAIRMSVALPLFLAPVELDGVYWCDGGIVDIFPVHPLLDIEEPCEVAVAVNCFYPHDFAGEDEQGWQTKRASILHVASQVRTCQQVQLARENLARLRASMEVVMLDPVAYEKVRGVGFYRQFLSNREWPQFMRQGRIEARKLLSRRARAVAA
jgi:NTE family protein